jgi:ABC-type microcin C transport system duplicated ATPase subunit YejF
MSEPLENILVVDKLITSFETEKGLLRAVDQVSFSVPEGETVGIVGEKFLVGIFISEEGILCIAPMRRCAKSGAHRSV